MTLSAAGIARVKRVLIAPFPIPLRSNIYGLCHCTTLSTAASQARNRDCHESLEIR